jgi:hypothetical protein
LANKVFERPSSPQGGWQPSMLDFNRLSIYANWVVRAFLARGFAVYVFDERGERHHLPHAHIQRRRQRVGSIYLLTLEIYDCRERLPRALLDDIRASQDSLLELWSELNDGD